MSLTIEYEPSKSILDESQTYELFTSTWVAAFSPIVYKIQNTKYPVNTETSIFNVLSIENNGGLLQLNLDADHGLLDGEYVQFTNFDESSLNAVYLIREVPTTDSLVIDFPFSSSIVLNLTETAQKAFYSYHNRVRVTAGLPSGHKWETSKPEEITGEVKQAPNSNNLAVFDIQEYINIKVNTLNDFALPSLPNDYNLWTGFKIEYTESYQGFRGLVDAPQTINSYTASADSTVSLSLTDTSSYQVGDLVELQGFTNPTLNGRFYVTFVNSLAIVIDLPFVAYVLTGTETVQLYDKTLVTFIEDYTPLEIQYYASNSKLPLKSPNGNNFLDYLNTTDVPRLALNSTKFDRRTLFYQRRDDIVYYVDKSLSDLATGATDLAFRVIQYDGNGNITSTQVISIGNQDEGLYRIPVGEVVEVPCVILQPNADCILTPNGLPINYTDCGTGGEEISFDIPNVVEFSLEFGLFDGVDFTPTSSPQWYDFDNECYQNEVLITWLNNLACWEYWLFTGKTDYGISFEDSETSEKNNFENWDEEFINSETEEFYYKIDAYNSNVIRSGFLNAQQANGVATLKTSIQAQRLQEDDNTTKLTILVDKNDFTYRKDRDKLIEFSTFIRDTDKLPIQRQ